MAMRAVAIGDEGTLQPGASLQYARWSSSIYQMERSAAVDAGFTVGSVKIDADYRMLVIDVARSAVKKVGRRRAETWGYGYRLLVEISDVSGMASLTLPAIAASVELGQVEASVRLEVNGYAGSELWDDLPVPRPLDVDTYKSYVAAAGRIQKIFSENPGNAVPVKLADNFESEIAEGGVTNGETSESVVLVGLLKCVDEELSKDEAVARLAAETDLEEGHVQQLADGLYSALGVNGDAASDSQAAGRAAAFLRPLRSFMLSTPPR